MWAFATRSLSLLLIAGLATGQTTCRTGRDKTPHQAALWLDEFPNKAEVEALCDGTIDVRDNGEICVTGRVTYKQLGEFLGTPIRAPAVDTISIPGHLVTGSANVILGYEANFLYDFVTRYTIGGISIPAGKGTADSLLAASNGLIEGFCLDKSFTKEPELYSISHSSFGFDEIEEDTLADANVIYASRYGIVAEYHKPSTNGPFFGTILNTVTTFFANLAPNWVFSYVPLLGATGIFRYVIAGSVSTSQWPQPLLAPDGTVVEAVQIDTEWSTLMSAMADGLFTDDKVPTYFGVLIKKITPLTDKSCWPVTAAAIDIQGPKDRGDAVDKWIKETVYPYLKARGNVGLHLGKRIESGSELLATAMETYNAQCGVTLNLAPTTCYHPACTRSQITTNFTYAEGLFRPARNDDGSDSGDSED